MTQIQARLQQVLTDVFQGSLDEMAKCMDVDRVSVYRYKNGKVRPSRRSLNLLQQRKGVSAEWVLKGGSEKIQYDTSPNVQASSTSLPLFLEPIESLQNTGPVVMRAELQTDSGKVGPNRYFLRLAEKKDYFLAGDFVLIQTCAPHPAMNLHLSEQYCVLKRDGKLVFDKLRAHDVAKSGKTWVVGVALSMQRSIRVEDYGVFEK
ncbi:MAG: hypothetical protein WCT04_09405 [Planctomycetota bacterium]